METFRDDKGVEHTLDFDAENHIYHLDGKEVDSVSSIINIGHDFRFVDQKVLAAAADLGSKVHKAVELFEKKTLNRAKLDPLLNDYLEQWIVAKNIIRFDPIAFETRVCSTKYHYAGTMDVHGLLLPSLPSDDVEEILIDVKSGASMPIHRLQTAGYRIAAIERGLVTEKCKRACIYLSPDSWEIDFHINNAYDSMAFISLSTYAYWKRHYGRKRN